MSMTRFLLSFLCLRTTFHRCAAPSTRHANALLIPPSLLSRCRTKKRITFHQSDNHGDLQGVSFLLPYVYESMSTYQMLSHRHSYYYLYHSSYYCSYYYYPYYSYTPPPPTKSPSPPQALAHPPHFPASGHPHAHTP